LLVNLKTIASINWITIPHTQSKKGRRDCVSFEAYLALHKQAIIASWDSANY